MADTPNQPTADEKLKAKLAVEQEAKVKAEVEAAELRAKLAALEAEKSAPVDEKAEEAKRLKKIVDNRLKAIDERKDLDKEEKEILKLHENGMQQFAIAKEVYKFVNSDTVSRVAFTIRREYATDFDQIEDVNSTKGYVGR